MSILEIIAMTFTLICVYLSSKQSIWCWPTGLVGVIAFFLLQVIFILQSIYGWYKWSKSNGGKDLPIKKIGIRNLLIQVFWVFSISALVGRHLWEYIGGNYPITDSVTSGLALLATYHIINKNIESWIVWMVFNVMLFALFIKQELYIVATLEGILFFISLNAYISWRKDLKTASA